MTVNWLAAESIDHLSCLMFDDHGVDDFDDGLAVVLSEQFEGLETTEQPGAGELVIFGGIAGEQIIHRGCQRVGQLDQRA